MSACLWQSPLLSWYIFELIVLNMLKFMQGCIQHVTMGHSTDNYGIVTFIVVMIEYGA